LHGLDIDHLAAEHRALELARLLHFAEFGRQQPSLVVKREHDKAAAPVHGAAHRVRELRAVDVGKRAAVNAVSRAAIVSERPAQLRVQVAGDDAYARVQRVVVDRVDTAAHRVAHHHGMVQRVVNHDAVGHRPALQVILKAEAFDARELGRFAGEPAIKAAVVIADREVSFRLRRRALNLGKPEFRGVQFFDDGRQLLPAQRVVPADVRAVEYVAVRDDGLGFQPLAQRDQRLVRRGDDARPVVSVRKHDGDAVANLYVGACAPRIRRDLPARAGAVGRVVLRRCARQDNATLFDAAAAGIHLADGDAGGFGDGGGR